MKNKKLVILLGIGILILGLILVEKDKSQKNIKEKDEKAFTTGIAMMLETTAGSGEYAKTDDTSYADVIARGYTFNSSKSTCKNGSTLSWNETNNTIIFSGNSTDNCTVYFDLYTKPIIKSVSGVSTISTNEFGVKDFKSTFTINAIGNIVKYTVTSVPYEDSQPQVHNGALEDIEITTNVFTYKTPQLCLDYHIFTIIAYDSLGNQSDPFEYRYDWYNQPNEGSCTSEN